MSTVQKTSYPLESYTFLILDVTQTEQEKKIRQEAPKYSNGTEFYKWKYFEWDEKVKPEDIEGNKKVRCVVTGKIWKSPDLGWVYNAKADEEIAGGDCNWNISMSIYTATSDKELDKQLRVNE